MSWSMDWVRLEGHPLLGDLLPAFLAEGKREGIFGSLDSSLGQIRMDKLDLALTLTL